MTVNHVLRDDPPAVRLREIPFLAMANLRTDRVDGLPTEPNTVLHAGDRDLLWLGPDEWLAVGPPGDTPWSDYPHAASVVNVSAARTTFEISGPCAREVLEKGCTLDLHPSAFHPGRCAQTLISSRVEVILHQLDAVPTYRLLVRASYASYLAAWLRAAMEEFGAAA